MNDHILRGACPECGKLCPMIKSTLHGRRWIVYCCYERPLLPRYLVKVER